MIEAVGHPYLETYFERYASLLKADGMFGCRDRSAHGAYRGSNAGEFYFCYCEGGFADASLGSVHLVWAKPMRMGPLQRRTPDRMVAVA